MDDARQTVPEGDDRRQLEQKGEGERLDELHRDFRLRPVGAEHCPNLGDLLGLGCHDADGELGELGLPAGDRGLVHGHAG